VAINELVVSVSSSFIELVSAPFKNPFLLWQIIPLLGLWVILELYFGYYKHEKLGWNTALANGVSLFWVALGTIQYVWERGYSEEYLSVFIFVFAMVVYAGFIIFITFKHFLSKKVAFFIASPPIIYYSCIMVILVTYEAIHLSGPMLLAILLLFIFFLIIKIIVQHRLPDKSSLDGDDDSEKSLSSFNKSGSSFNESSSDFDLSDYNSYSDSSDFNAGNSSGFNDSNNLRSNKNSYDSMRNNVPNNSRLVSPNNSRNILNNSSRSSFSNSSLQRAPSFDSRSRRVKSKKFSLFRY
jgi:hypothetical protein